MKTYVTVHDSSIIMQCESEGRFAGLDRVYLFVGPRMVDVPSNIPVIRCLDYQPNYEHLPQFYDFTGWFILAKHNLLDSDKAIFLQYDHLVTDPNIEERIAILLEEHPMVSCHAASREWWTLDIPNFYEVHIRGIEACGENWSLLMQQNPFEVWPSTQGTAWRTSEFVQFMLWFEPAFEIFKTHLYAGHLAERMIQPFLMANSWVAGYLDGGVFHESLDCHGTRDLSLGNVEGFSKKQSIFGK